MSFHEVSGTRVVLALVCAAVFLPYLNSLSAGFAGDALGLVLGDPRVPEASAHEPRPP